MLDYDTLKIIWWILVAVLLIGFALTDGHDMGGGILLPFLGKNDEERRTIINVFAPHWDGNQVWLVTGGAALFAAWPPVYAAAFSTFYLVLLATLWALLLRPGGFEYRSKLDNPGWRNSWDWALFVGSAIPAIIFGAAFGNLLLGVDFSLDNDLRPIPAGTLFGQLHPFALLTGVVGLTAIVLQGATYIALRTEGVLRKRADAVAHLVALLLIATFLIAGIWVAVAIDGFRIMSMPPGDSVFTPLAKEVVQAEGAWLDNYFNHPWTALAPLLALLGAVGVLVSAGKGAGAMAFLSSSAAITGVILTAGASLFPFIMPSRTQPDASLTLWDATSSHLTLNLMFWIVVIFMPIVLAYTYWAFRVMWRRIDVATVREETHTLY